MVYFSNEKGNQELESSSIGYENTQQQSGASPYYQPMIMASEKSDLYDKIRPEDVIETVRYLLMGYEFDKNFGSWKFSEYYRDIALSRVGAYQISAILFPVSNKSVSISKLKDDEIRLRVKSLVRTAMKMCLRNWQEYGIRSPEQLYFVKEVVLSISFITLKQPEDAGVRAFIQGVTQESRIVHETPEKKGVVGSLFRR